jgi:hypothetical protein
VKTGEESVRPQHRVLHHIFRIRSIAQKPTRQVYPSVKMRQHELLKPDSLV